MKLTLSEGQILIERCAVPFAPSSVLIDYAFEKGTAHLIPRLTVNKVQYKGDHPLISLLPLKDTCKLVVELLDTYDRVVKTYTSTFNVNNFITLGELPINRNMIQYIVELEKRIIELEEKGEVL